MEGLQKIFEQIGIDVGGAKEEMENINIEVGEEEFQ